MASGWSSGELPGAVGGFCEVNVTIHSPGIWNPEGARSFLQYALPRLYLQLAVIFIVSQVLHMFLKRLGFQRIISEILAGLILGPSFMGRIPNFSQTLFPREGEVFLDSLGKLGFIFFIFLIGVKMEPSTIRTIGKKAWTIGIVSMITSTAVGLFVSYMSTAYLTIQGSVAARTVIGVQIVTPFAVVASLLIDMKLMNSELGRLALASTLISDLVSTALGTLMSVVKTAFASRRLSQMIVSITMFLFTILHILRRFFLWIIKQTPEGKPVDGGYVAIIAVLVLASAVISDNIGLQYQIGPFILGLVVPNGPPLGSTLVERLESLVNGLFAPLLVINCGLKVNIFVIYYLGRVQLAWALFFFCGIVKVLTVILPARLCRLPVKDAFILSIIMSTQGIVEIALYQIDFMNQSIDLELLATGILSVLLMDLVTSSLLRSLYDTSRIFAGYRRRDVESLAVEVELRILACTYRQEDAIAAIKLLEYSNPTRESSIGVYALHLVELLGQASPLLINHGLGQKASTSYSRSARIIEVFNHYEKQYPGVVDVQAFTAMSMTKFMKYDICYLAFDKLVSIIILPFHRKWNQLGKIVMDSSTLRLINKQVLDMAPCSVGIFIDRHKLRRTLPGSAALSVYRVAVIFIGGSDDREALAYGRRMVKTSGVHLSVIRLMARDETEEDEDAQDMITDSEVLHATKAQCSRQSNMIYREELVNDGSGTANLVRQMTEVFDFIIIGRRHREDLTMLSGLKTWIDVPELGPIGDILASPDIDKPTSILVVQQQLTKK